MQLSLDLLLLTEDELQVARKQVRDMAYFKWQAAGRPSDGALTFWREAEREWINYHYVPDRYQMT